jgi:hypothetical protein
MHAHSHMHTLTHAHTHTHARTHMHARSHMHTLTHARTHTHARTLTHMHTPTRAHTHAHTYIRELTHSHTHSFRTLIVALIKCTLSSYFQMTFDSPYSHQNKSKLTKSHLNKFQIRLLHSKDSAFGYQARNWPLRLRPFVIVFRNYKQIHCSDLYEGTDNLCHFSHNLPHITSPYFKLNTARNSEVFVSTAGSAFVTTNCSQLSLVLQKPKFQRL